MLSPASFIDPTINSNVVMNIRFYIMLPLVCLSLFGCSKQEPTIERPFDYPFCEWQGELKDGKPNGKGFGGCVVGQERPGVGFYSTFKTLKPEQCNDESDRCQCERFWRTSPNLDYYTIFDGHYVDGVRSGEGTFLYPDGNLYIGNWENDRRHGYGVFFDVDCKILEQGDWCADNVGTCASK